MTRLSKKIYRMAVGYDKYSVHGDVEAEAEEYIDKYIDSLEVFHKNTMTFLDSLDVYENADRMDKVKELQTLIKYGEDIKEFVLDGNVHTDN